MHLQRLFIFLVTALFFALGCNNLTGVTENSLLPAGPAIAYDKTSGGNVDFLKLNKSKPTIANDNGVVALPGAEENIQRPSSCYVLTIKAGSNVTILSDPAPPSLLQEFKEVFVKYNAELSEPNQGVELPGSLKKRPIPALNQGERWVHVKLNANVVVESYWVEKEDLGLVRSSQLTSAK